MSKMYVVEGVTGEYSDTRTWVVGVCFEEALAIKHVEVLNGIAAQHGVLMTSKRNRPSGQARDAAQKLLHDAGDTVIREIDYNGVSYSYTAVALLQ